MRIRLIGDNEFELEVESGDNFTIEETPDGSIEVHKNRGSDKIEVKQEYNKYALCHILRIK